MKDFLGQDLCVGDRVVYGATLGRCAAVGVGVIVKLNHSPTDDPWNEPMQVQIQPQKTQHEYEGSWASEREPNAVHKPRWYKFANRMVKIV